MIQNKNAGRSGFLDTALEGIQHDYGDKSMFIVFFLIRRYATSFVLLGMVKWPYFQCAFLMVFSFLNLSYVLTVRPMDTKKNNIIEIFNEVCVYSCSMIVIVI